MNLISVDLACYQQPTKDLLYIMGLCLGERRITASDKESQNWRIVPAVRETTAMHPHYCSERDQRRLNY